LFTLNDGILSFQIADKDKLGAKLTDSDKEKIEEAVNEKISWLESNSEADSDQFKAQKKELEDIVQPIIAKLPILKTFRMFANLVEIDPLVKSVFYHSK